MASSSQAASTSVVSCVPQSSGSLLSSKINRLITASEETTCIIKQPRSCTCFGHHFSIKGIFPLVWKDLGLGKSSRTNRSATALAAGWICCTTTLMCTLALTTPFHLFLPHYTFRVYFQFSGFPECPAAEIQRELHCLLCTVVPTDIPPTPRPPKPAVSEPSSSTWKEVKQIDLTKPK